MKLTGKGNYIVRGQNTEDNGPTRINLFDGTYKTGWRIVRFDISGESRLAANDVSAKVTTELVTTGGDDWRWNAQREVAWASNNMLTTSVRDTFDSVVDDSIILVEEMYVYVHSNQGTDYDVNYLIELEPVDLKDWEYSLSYVQNKSQG